MEQRQTAFLRPFWQKLFPNPALLGTLLIFLWGIPRFIIVLLANQPGSYQFGKMAFFASPLPNLDVLVVFCLFAIF